MIKIKKITKAILPVAGFGTRFLSATKAQPKEMLPVVDKPAVQYLVEDAAASGIEKIIFVTGRGKRAIEDHFDSSFELEQTLVEKNKLDLLEKVKAVENLAKFAYVRQPTPKGDGHAISCAAHLVEDEAVLVLFGDTIYDTEIPISRQVIEVYEKYGAPVIGLTEVAENDYEKFGMVGGLDLGDGIIKIEKIVEKPKNSAEAPSSLAAPGVYVITPEVLEILANMDYGESGEIRLADAFAIMLRQGKPIYGKKLSGEWLDTGNKLNFLKASIKLGLKDGEIGSDLRDFIASLK
jgi:UTP--glucose-1-phosphate uridylyltransferase